MGSEDFQQPVVGGSDGRRDVPPLEDDRVLHSAGLDLRSVNREGGRIPSQAQSRLMEIAARELADDCYGLHLAAKVDVRDADALASLSL